MGAAMHEGHAAFSKVLREGERSSPPHSRGRVGGRGRAGYDGRPERFAVGDDPDFHSSRDVGGGGGRGRGRGRRGDMWAPGDVGDDEYGYARSPRGRGRRRDEAEAALFEGPWDGGRGRGGRGGRGRGGRGRGSRDRPGRGDGGYDGGRGPRYRREDQYRDAPDDPYWEAEDGPLVLGPPSRRGPRPMGGRGEWDEGRGGRAALPPRAELLAPEWDEPDPRFEHGGGRGGRGGRRGGRGARGGRGGRGGRGRGRGRGSDAHYRPHPDDLPLPAADGDWSPERGGGEGWGRRRGPVDEDAGFREWSALDDSPPRAAAPAERGPMGAGRGRAIPRGGDLGHGPELLGPVVLGMDPVDRGMLPPGDRFGNGGKPSRARRRQVG